MFQSDDLQLQTLEWEPSNSSPLQTRRHMQVVTSSSKVTSAFRNSVPAGISTNKKAIIDRLINLYAQGELG